MSFLRACEGFGQGTTRVAQSHGTGENLSNIMFLTVFTRAPPATFPRAEAKIKTINLPENVLCFYPSPTCVFGLRAIESKEQGVREEKEMAIADKFFHVRKQGRTRKTVNSQCSAFSEEPIMKHLSCRHRLSALH
ncbi:hypothetical protein JHK82_035284 [Glycine max]|nr:hypothetical protein JHK85_036010 [Glycine max]KAG4975941.1 hypothetical protein JHK86_035415 [Glycine max]KAG5112015.1 hypothetical protein JHK82_035284 [Glycine max]KAG5129303.1 hypothetical protein JHK84_035700 [Glycine max]